MGDPNRHRGARQRSKQWLQRFKGTCGWGNTGRSGTPAIPRHLETAVARAHAQMLRQAVVVPLQTDKVEQRDSREMVEAVLFYERPAPIVQQLHPGPFARRELLGHVEVIYLRRRAPVYCRQARRVA